MSGDQDSTCVRNTYTINYRLNNIYYVCEVFCIKCCFFVSVCKGRRSTAWCISQMLQAMAEESCHFLGVVPFLPRMLQRGHQCCNNSKLAGGIVAVSVVVIAVVSRICVRGYTLRIMYTLQGTRNPLVLLDDMMPALRHSYSSQHNCSACICLAIVQRFCTFPEPTKLSNHFQSKDNRTN